MEFRINKEKILKGLSKIQGITGKKTNIPITSNVVISTQEAHLSILATDLEIAFQGDYEADILCEGSTAVPSRKFFEIVKDFPSTLVIVKELQNKWIQIADKKVEYKIVGVDTDEFPGIPNVEGVELFNINGDLLRNMIEKTIYAVLSDEGRAHLAGVFFQTIVEGDIKNLRMVSTDGHRLSKIDQPINEEEDLGIMGGVIIPKGGMIEVQRLLEGGGTVQIGFKDNNFVVKRDREALIIRLIEGEFPDYELIIPKKKRGEVRVERDSFLMMLKRMTILSSDKYRSIHCKINKEQMETITINPEIGESREVVPIVYDGQDIEMAFNPRYFIDAISTMKSEEVIIKINDEDTPCVLEGNSDPGFLGVVMPMRI
jgi:DNA polymerase-3 subunit beta